MCIAAATATKLDRCSTLQQGRCTGRGRTSPGQPLPAFALHRGGHIALVCSQPAPCPVVLRPQLFRAGGLLSVLVHSQVCPAAGNRWAVLVTQDPGS